MSSPPMKKVGDGQGFEFGEEKVDTGDQTIGFNFQVDDGGGTGDQALPGGPPSPQKSEQAPKPRSSKKIILTRGGSYKPFQMEAVNGGDQSLPTVTPPKIGKSLLKKPRATVVRPPLDNLTLKVDTPLTSNRRPSYTLDRGSIRQDQDKTSMMSSISRKTGITKGSRATGKTFNSKQIMTVQTHKQMELIVQKIQKVTTLENFMSDVIENVVDPNKASIPNEDFNKYLKEKYVSALGLEDRKF
jgi:hypothetical protein